MADLIPERLEPTTGASSLERQESFRDASRQARRRPQPASPRPTEEEPEAEAAETVEPTHQLDRMA